MGQAQIPTIFHQNLDHNITTATTFLWVSHTQEAKACRSDALSHCSHGRACNGQMDYCHHKLQGVVCWVVMGDWDVFMHGMEAEDGWAHQWAKGDEWRLCGR